MEELISKKKLLADLLGIKDMLVAAGDPFLASVMNRAIQCVENQPLVPHVEPKPDLDNAPEDKKLENAIRQLKETYERAKTLDFVYNKLGWALYQVWKTYE